MIIIPVPPSHVTQIMHNFFSLSSSFIFCLWPLSNLQAPVPLETVTSLPALTIHYMVLKFKILKN